MAGSLETGGVGDAESGVDDGVVELDYRGMEVDLDEVSGDVGWLAQVEEEEEEARPRPG